MTIERFRVDGGDLHEQRSRDVEPLIEQNKALQRAGATGIGDMRLAARVDGIVIEAYCTRNGITFAEFMHNAEHQRLFLNDPDNAAFRVWQGRV